MDVDENNIKVKKPISDNAKRALAEAKKRHDAKLAKNAKLAKEINGRKGLEPTRYGDWEVKGISSDF